MNNPYNPTSATELLLSWSNYLISDAWGNYHNGVYDFVTRLLEREQDNEMSKLHRYTDLEVADTEKVTVE